MLYSFIIPTLKRPEDVKNLLQDISGFDLSTQDSLEVVLFNDEADGKTKEMANSPWNFPVKYLDSSARVNSCVSRNRCLEVAEGDWIIFLDDDVRLKADFITKVAGVSHAFEGFSFRMELPNKKGSQFLINQLLESYWPGRVWAGVGHFIGGFDRRYLEPKLVDHLPGANMIFSRRAIGQIRFDEKIGPGTGYLDDADFSYSVKLKNQVTLAYISDYAISHLQTPSGGNRQLDRREWYYYYQRNKFYFFKKHFTALISPGVAIFNFFDCVARCMVYRTNLLPVFFKALKNV